MYTVRVHQHKHREKTDQEDYRAIRSANQKLRKENKRLRKEVDKLLAREGVMEYDPPELLVKVKKETSLCPKCDSEELTVVDLGIKILTVCKKCLYRKTNEPKPKD